MGFDLMSPTTKDCDCVEEYLDHNWKTESFTRTTRCEAHEKKHKEDKLADQKRREDENKRRKDKYDQMVQSLENVQDTICVRISDVLPDQKARDDFVKDTRQLHSVMKVRKEKNRWWVNAECLKIYEKYREEEKKTFNGGAYFWWK